MNQSIQVIEDNTGAITIQSSDTAQGLRFDHKSSLPALDSLKAVLEGSAMRDWDEADHFQFISPGEFERHSESAGFILWDECDIRSHIAKQHAPDRPYWMINPKDLFYNVIVPAAGCTHALFLVRANDNIEAVNAEFDVHGRSIPNEPNKTASQTFPGDRGKFKECPECDGKAFYPESKERCTACNGYGHVIC